MTDGDRVRRMAVSAAAVAVLCSACDLTIGLDLAVSRGGAGTLTLTVDLDAELDDLLRASGFDPARGLTELRAAAPSWEVEVAETDDGGSRLVAVTEFADPAAFARLSRDLQAALGPEDGRLFEGLAIQVRSDGSIVVEGQVGLRPPEAPGATGLGVDFGSEEFAALMAERGDELVTYDVTVHLPARPREHDADEADGGTLVWHAPVGRLRTLSAVSEPPTTPVLVVVGVVLAVAAALGVTVVVVTRRRATRA